MADAAVEFLLNNLKDLLLYHSHLISGNKEKIQTLEKDLRLFKAFLNDSQKKRRKDEVTKVMVQDIRDVVYELEDVIDGYVTHAIEKKSRFQLVRPVVTLHNIGEKVDEVKGKVERARAELASLRVDRKDAEDGTPPARHPIEKDVVGFTDVTEELIGRLTQETDFFDVVSLTGMYGLGKTTLAWKIFNDLRITYEFPVRIWLSVSQEFSEKKIFLDILEKFAKITEDIQKLDPVEIARQAAGYLETGKFLIVFDDVWRQDDWDKLRIAIPNVNKEGKILITSRSEEVGNYASRPRLPKPLRLLYKDEGWELLQSEASCKPEPPHELETIGNLIVRDCGFLPLAIVIIGGILATKYSALDVNSMTKGWEKVSQRVRKYINENDPGDRLKKFISLSYDILPDHLRACFLYLGMFPEDYKIPASKLILMWIGEGFIQRDNDCSLEETGETYLEDLINRNLVTIDTLKPDGKVKTCRVHDTLRDFCRREAAQENLLQEINYAQGDFSPPIANIDKYRRLAIHSNCLEFINGKPSGPHVRSFVCFSKHGFTLPEENIARILKAFKLVRVLDVKPIKFTNISNDMYRLVHARYICLSLDLAVLPKKFSELWNIQTLIVDTKADALNVKANIWKLSRLRHFKTNVSATLPKPSSESKHGAELQTLGTISVESCTAELLERACNLTKLAIRGRLALLLEGKVGSFETLGKMKFLEKLKLVNDVHPRPASEGRLSGLPQPYQFPSNLKSLTLVATYLSWNSMTTLGLLGKLEVLKLKKEAFTGRTWSVDGGGFRHLEFLEIEETDLCAWEASSHHFPRLKGLVLKKCGKLDGIPVGLADIESLQRLELFFCESAAASAKKIQDAKTLVKGSAFKLSIFPPIQ